MYALSVFFNGLILGALGLIVVHHVLVMPTSDLVSWLISTEPHHLRISRALHPELYIKELEATATTARRSVGLMRIENMRLKRLLSMTKADLSEVKIENDALRNDSAVKLIEKAECKMYPDKILRCIVWRDETREFFGELYIRTLGGVVQRLRLRHWNSKRRDANARRGS